MLKTNIKYKYAIVLATELKKEFGIEFTVVDCGDIATFVADRVLTVVEKYQVVTGMNLFKAGIRVIESELLFNVGS